MRLIPAWAGKTFQTEVMPRLQAAHPRVGGENHLTKLSQHNLGGSSPRGRGKRIL